MASNSSGSGSGSHHQYAGGRSNYQGGRRAKKVHNNEYNHDMEKQLQAHQNQAEFIPHDSFLKKFSTRTQHESSQSQLQSMARVQSHSSLAVLGVIGDSNENNSIKQTGSTKQAQCSFKLESDGTNDDKLETGLLLAESNVDKEGTIQTGSVQLVGGILANTEDSSPSSNLLVPPLPSTPQPQPPVSRWAPAHMFKRNKKSMSITSAISNASSLQIERTCFDRILIKCNYFVFGPDDNPMFVWLFLLNFCVLYNIWLIIARQSFEKLQTEYQNYWRVADFVADTVYFLDVVIQFRTGYLEQGLLVYDSKKLALNYIRSKKFLLDLFAMTPLELIQLWYGYPIPILRFPRFFKLYRTIELYYITESRTLYPNVWRVANLTHILFCLGHWFAGFYFLISKAEGFRGHWSYPEPVDEFALLSRMYLRSLYWSTLTLTTIGDLPPPETNWQWLKEMSNFRYLFSIAVHYLAVFVIALIVGQVGNVITNRNANRVEFERLLDGAKQYMRNHNVPTEMQKRVQRWYDYSWSRGRMNGAGDIHSIGLLPDKLKTELALHVNLETLRKVTIFQECQPEFLHDLVLKMRAYIFTPGDVICRRGEIAREMFIIADGVLEVIGESGQVLTKMYSGDFFGEIGILNIEGASNKRTADVRSVGYAELFSLSKEDVLTAVKDYPEAERILIEYGRRRLNQNTARKSSTIKGPELTPPTQVGVTNGSMLGGVSGGPMTLTVPSGVGINGVGGVTSIPINYPTNLSLAPSLKITNESLSSSKAASDDTLDNPSSPTSAGGIVHHPGGSLQHATPHHHGHYQRHHHRRLSVAKLMSMKERAKYESEDAGSVTNDMLPSASEHRGLTTDMLGLPTLFSKQAAAAAGFSTASAAALAAAAAAATATAPLESSRNEVQSLLGSVITSDKLTAEKEKEKWLEIELMNANLGRSAESRKIVDSLEQITSMCLNRNDVNMENVIESINKLKDEIDAKKEAKYENFIDLVEQKDAKIKLLESRIKILQKYLTQREVVS